ncbi:MAG: NAD/FAD-dependent oxidoreductase-like [Frankiales bacterium]|nr:NAD/FAD-dependent oxidoreductase-like [Frankiales bacterium]
MTVCVVGAGIAGTACARALQDGGLDVVVLDRGRVPGGRMASRRLPGYDAGRYVDLGASYFTVRDDRFRAQVDDWTSRGLARAWTDTFTVLPSGERKSGPTRYGAGGGLRSLVVDLARDLDVRPETQVRAVTPGPAVDGAPYDAVVLAMPDPQALAVLDPALAPERAALAGREWQPVLALAARFAERTWEPATFSDGAFVHDDDVVDWVADDGRRRGDDAPVLVAHSTPAFAATRLAEPGAAAPELTAALRRLLDLPAPSTSFVQRWTYAKPVGERDAPCFLGDVGIGLCGDGWGASKVEAAYLSGITLAQQLLARRPAGAPGAGGC